jgi:hypothetical protein
MKNELKPIGTNADYERALSEVESLWIAKLSNTGSVAWEM